MLNMLFFIPSIIFYHFCTVHAMHISGDNTELLNIIALYLTFKCYGSKAFSESIKL